MSSSFLLLFFTRALLCNFVLCGHRGGDKGLAIVMNVVSEMNAERPTTVWLANNEVIGSGFLNRRRGDQREEGRGAGRTGGMGKGGEEGGGGIVTEKCLPSRFLSQT